MKERIATGHRDCRGKMIHEGDTVYVPDGNGVYIWRGVIVWEDGKWWLSFGQGMNNLNRYSAEALLRGSEDGTIAGQPVGQ